MKINAFLILNESVIWKRLTTSNARYYTDTSLNIFFISTSELSSDPFSNEATNEAEKKKIVSGKMCICR